ncbi:MAG TPA: ribosome biogenesis GTPase Der [Spirochaetota bacterium]|nr:ribosome biogenesis GTPase Der [Spirochaetota bacterium]HPJ33850.1 ribosome biogenesis GTPase Der [Spirochaetota bacterium]
MSSKLPVVSIVGRQNVGKSTLFNALIKDKKSIVDSFPGLTRDVISHTVVHNSVSFVISDTPGLDLSSSSELSEQILENAKNHLSRSSVILFLMESPGPESFDYELADIVRKMNLPTIVAVNKMDSTDKMENMSNFYEMGFTEIIPVSAMRRFNISMLLDNIVRLLPVKRTAVSEPELKIAVVGRPNSGKSTLLNSFMGYERAVVSDVPGTTRDSVDETFTYYGKTIQIIDTAGIRKKSKITENIEYYSFTRTVESINRCDVAIHLIDATVGLTENDKKISDEILKAKKPIIIAINKWDAVEKDHKTFKEYRDRLIFKYYRAEDFPIISVSAKNRQRTDKLLQTAFTLNEKAHKRIDTPTLNRVISDIKSVGRIPQLGEKIRVYYAVQIDTVPPSFRFFVNNADHFRKDVIRYFEKSLKEAFDMEGLPIVIQIEGKKRDDGRRKKKN